MAVRRVVLVDDGAAVFSMAESSEAERAAERVRFEDEQDERMWAERQKLDDEAEEERRLDGFVFRVLEEQEKLMARKLMSADELLPDGLDYVKGENVCVHPRVPPGLYEQAYFDYVESFGEHGPPGRGKQRRAILKTLGPLFRSAGEAPRLGRPKSPITDDEVRARAVGIARAAGHELKKLLLVRPAGPPTMAEKPALDTLGLVARSLRAEGVTVDAIARMMGRSKSTISGLCKRQH